MSNRTRIFRATRRGCDLIGEAQVNDDGQPLEFNGVIDWQTWDFGTVDVRTTRQIKTSSPWRATAERFLFSQGVGDDD